MTSFKLLSRSVNHNGDEMRFHYSHCAAHNGEARTYKYRNSIATCSPLQSLIAHGLTSLRMARQSFRHCVFDMYDVRTDRFV